MDTLAALNVDELPEQQTRMMHLLSTYPDFDGRLGHDCCACCGCDLEQATIFTCPNCQRVNYCSSDCYDKDRRPVLSTPTIITDCIGEENDDESVEEEKALGHSPLVCTLLCTCRHDDAVENDDEKSLTTLDERTIKASQDRIQSELESYPATLANVLLSLQPNVYTKRLQQASASSGQAVLHVIGASQEVELWDALPVESSSSSLKKYNNKLTRVWEAYADALAEVVERYQLQRVKLYFIGPDCPGNNDNSNSNSNNTQATVAFASVSEGRIDGELQLYTIQGEYTSELLEEHAVVKPDIVYFFNPGFTVPEYKDWKLALASVPSGTPFVLTTNTELEGIADAQFMLEQDRIQSIARGLAEIFGLYSPDDDDDDDDNVYDDDNSESFFSVNPFCGSRVRQSGTMANDLYVKNRWMLGGVMASYDPDKARTVESSKRQRTTTMGNSKKSNPALI